MNASHIMQLRISTRRRTRRQGYVRIRLHKDSRGNFVSWKETLLGVVLVALSFLALHWIVAQNAPPADRDVPASAAAYRT
jgi:hypothetical protein